MKSRPPPDPRHLDIAALCRAGATLRGQGDAGAFERLADSLWLEADGASAMPLEWSVRGVLKPVRIGEPEMWIELKAQADVRLQCQRCLQALRWPLALDRRIRFVADEEQAAVLDEDSEDDVLALPPRLDLPALIEDELILALPLVPRHETCSEPLPAGDASTGRGVPIEAKADEEHEPHPFAALAALRNPRA